MFTVFTVNSKPQYEKIYAVMITGKDSFHKLLAMNSIKSFLNQTYPNKHLIIVNDGDYSLAHINPELITEIKLENKQVLGKLRNIGLRYIPENGVYLQWDDDDWHHPKLMEEQYKSMISSEAQLCLLQNQVQYAFKINSSWVKKNNTGIMGTIMCRKKNNIKYPIISKSEDDYFLRKYAKYPKAVFNNPAHYYLRFIHGYNTWDDAHFEIGAKQTDAHLISNESKKYLLDVLPLYNFVKQ